MSEHNLGIGSSYLKRRLPVKLMWHGEFNDVRHAIAFEKQVKGWSRKKKESLFNQDWKEYQS